MTLQEELTKTAHRVGLEGQIPDLLLTEIYGFEVTNIGPEVGDVITIDVQFTNVDGDPFVGVVSQSIFFSSTADGLTPIVPVIWTTESPATPASTTDPTLVSILLTGPDGFARINVPIVGATDAYLSMCLSNVGRMAVGPKMTFV